MGRSAYFTGYRDPEQWAELGLIGDRLSFTDDDTITKLGLGYIKSQGCECAMDTAVRFTLLNAGENGELNAKQMLNPYTRLAALIEAGIVADGWYKNEDGKSRQWVYAEGFPKLHWNRMASSYNYDNAHFSSNILGRTDVVTQRHSSTWNSSTYSYSHPKTRYLSFGEGKDTNKYCPNGEGFTTYLFSENKRMLSNLLDDKEVLSYINKSLNRMVKSGKAIQVTAGRGRTFRWNAWGWLDDYRQKHLVTMAKQRKLGDVVNGWEFTKGRVSNIHGVEICEHEWRPAEPVQAFTISMNVPEWQDNSRWRAYGGYYASHPSYQSGIRYSAIQLPYLFFSQEEAEEAVEHFSRLPSNGGSMKLDGVPAMPQYSVEAIGVAMTVEGAAMIEDYHSPQEMYKRMQLADEDTYIHYQEMLLVSPAKIAGVHTTPKEE